MRKKLLSALLCLGLCLSLPPAALAQGEEEYQSMPYVFYDPDAMAWGLSDFIDGVEVAVLPAEYSYIGIFQDGIAIVQKNTDTYGSTYGLVDYKGNFILPVEYSVLTRGSYDESDNILRARKIGEDFYRYLRPDGTPLTDYTFIDCSDFCRHIGVGCRIIDGKALYGAVNAQGDILIPFEYDSLSDPYPSYYSMEWLSSQKDGCCGAFDYNGNLLRRCIYPDNVLLLQSLSLPAQMTEEEELGHLIAASQTWKIDQYSNGYESDLWGYSFQRDTAQGTETCWAFYPQFLSAQPFDETGHAQVTRKDGTVGVIDQSGRFTPAPLNDRFSDVLSGSWYDQGVTTCAKRGVMVGTSETTFSPDAELTDPECLTLALRLYDLQQGGDGTLEKAPEDYGYMTLTLADGKTFSRYGEYTPFFNYHVPDDGGDGTVYVQAPGDTPEEREAYAKAHEGAATFMAEGKTYSGTVTAGTFGYYFGPCLLFSFDCPEAQRPDLDELFGHGYLPAPDKWFRDAVYTAYQWGLSDADGFDRLVSSSVGQSSWMYSTSRDVFARALATAAGELEKKYDVPRIPDMERSEYNKGVYSLYEAGILNGTDSFGTFQADKELTRAECAVMVARVLDPAQRLAAPPATPNGYEQAVIDLRSKTGHHNEQRLETDECTIFIYDRGGFMNAPTGAMTVIYKPGSALGDGYVLELPHAWVKRGLAICYPADTMTLSEDGKTFTYTYYREEDLGEPVRKAGAITYTVDLPTGEVTESWAPHSYATSLAHVTRKRGGNYYADLEVAQTLEAPDCTAVLTKSSYGEYDDYALSLVYKPGSTPGDGAIKRLVLPSTVCPKGYSGYRPTDRTPDSLSLSEDGLSLRYTYYFNEALTDGDTVLHEAGEYIYTADLTTGEVTAKIDPASQQNLTYHGILGSLETEEGYESAYNTLNSYQLPDGVELILRHKAAAGDPDKRDYEFYLLRRDAQPQLLRLPLPSTELLADGSAPTTREPDSIRSNFNSYSEENEPPVITYTYRFPQPLWSGDTLLHDKGTYVYTVDITTGKQSVELMDAYEKSLADAIQTGGTWRVDHQLETPLCTILVQHSDGFSDGNGFAYPGADVTLIFKDGSPNGAGEVVDLPVLSGTLRYGSIPPHRVWLSEDKTVFTYVYQFDENQYAHTLSGLPYLNLKAGTYTYTVDLTAGTVEETIELKEEQA